MKKPIIFLLCTFISFSSFAWNARGHMLIAAIAYNGLNSDQKEQITELLKFHPDYAKRWAKDYKKVKNKMDLGQFLLMRASIWPDEIRSSKNPNFKFHRPEWHYVTYKIDFVNGHKNQEIDGEEEPNIVWAITYTKKMIENKKLDHSARAMYLAWLIHLIGDIHQPLHCGSLFNSTYPKGDRGGNKFFVKPKKAAVKLHKIWDYALGSKGKRNEDKIKNQATRIKSEYKSIMKDFDLLKFDPFNWSLESFDHAVINVYLNGKLNGSLSEENAQILPNDYTKNMKILSEKRALLAGVRLENTINDLKINSHFHNHDDD